MSILVVGASGATGKLLVEQLISYNYNVKAVVRNPEKLPKSWKKNKNIKIIHASLLELTDEEIGKLTYDCHSVISCLGHNLTFKGIYGNPRRLVTEAAERICKSIELRNPKKPIKYILMNTVGNKNHDLEENISFAQKLVIGVLRLLLPPFVDNEKAAEYFRIKIGKNNKSIEWVLIRPDTLTDEKDVTEYEIHESPTRSAIFDPGKTSRINVGNFMARLINDNNLWNTWKNRMPVLYNK